MVHNLPALYTRAAIYSVVTGAHPFGATDQWLAFADPCYCAE